MKNNSVISLDAIDVNSKRANSFFPRLFKTRHHGGQGIKKMPPFGHYMFCGEQGSGKTLSAIWYAEKLKKEYEKRKCKVDLYSNIGIGKEVDNINIYRTIFDFDTDIKHIKIVIIDELATYYPKDTKDKGISFEIECMTGLFDQLRKRKTFVLTVSQIYGKVNKSLREQCLYMINCRKSYLTDRIVNDFVPQKNILCDELGRWSGVPTVIHVHGLPKSGYDTNRIIFRKVGIFQLPLTGGGLGVSPNYNPSR